ncbi:MAG TPA: hydrophobe/amphiphile efflux-1 family RND transporter [Lentisphaeria bacterium]|nr:hydrophobe/amphiphile efflux-1 family RND transporter [Lentisphaeria bacterium]HCG47763.1 hydrophobe/amphiphile efflux-1 family RND transporter [Lentisphaeria bacterium]
MISQFFINRPRFAIVIAILFLLSGLIALFTLPITLYPNITPSVITVSTRYPGADAQTVLDTVIQPIESQINGVKRMLYMSSTATDDGSASVKVTFDIGTDGDTNTVNTQNRVNWATAQLPQEVQRQGVITKEASSNILAVITLYSPNGTYSELELSNFMSISVKDEIARIPGVGDVMEFGEMTYAMRIWLDTMRMASLKVTVEDVKSAIAAQNVQVSAGALGDAPSSPEQAERLSVAAQGRLANPEQFGSIVIRSNSDGSQVRLRDIARVEMGAETYSGISTLNGKPAAMLAVYQLNEANGLEIAREINKRLDRLKNNLFPEDLEYGIQYDTTKFITASIDEVKNTLFEAVLLVVLVTFLFLQDWRSTLVPTIAIPVSLVGTFAVMLGIGYSINMTTLFGLILAIGIVVDDAIVVIENVSRLMEEEHLPPKEAALKSMKQVTGPIIATTSVLLAMFVPVCFLPGITGVMYRQFGITISVAVFISMINALTLSPALCALLLKPVDPNRRKFFFFRWFDAGFDKLTRGYSAIVKSLLRKSVLVLLLYAVMGAGALKLYTLLPTGFIPNEDQGAFFVSVQLPDGASLMRTEKVTQKVTGILRGIPEVEDFIFTSGFNILNGINASNCAFGIVTLKDWSERKDKEKQQDAVIAKFYAKALQIPDASIVPFGVPSIPGLGTTSGFSLMLQDTSGNMTPQDFQKTLNEILVEANNSPVFSSVYSTFRASFPQVYLDIDREKAIRLGVTPDSINTALQGIFGSTYVNDFNKYGKSYKVELQGDNVFRDDVRDLTKAYVRNGKGDMVPLGTLVDIKYNFVPQFLTRYNMFQSVLVNGSAAPGYSSGQAMDEMEKIVKKVNSGMSFEWTDMSYQEKLAGNQIVIVFALALLFIYLFLVAQYESWMIPFSVLLSVPVAFLGAVLSLYLLNIENNIYTQVGFVLLFGIACKTAILIVEFAKEQHEKGTPILEAAEYAARLRFRAVLMTAVSFILGTFPLVVALGAGAVSRRSLGTAVFGGMLVSVIIGTLLIPVFYAVIQRMIEWARKKTE